MITKKAILMVLSLLSLHYTSSPCLALDGDEFYEFCKSSDPVKQAAGTFYSISIADRNLINNQGNPDKGPFCIPLDTTREKIFDIACKRFESNPKWLELNATWGIRSNFKKYFPCKQKVEVNTNSPLGISIV